VQVDASEVSGVKGSELYYKISSSFSAKDDNNTNTPSDLTDGYKMPCFPDQISSETKFEIVYNH